jgi:hypothetical protein
MTWTILKFKALNLRTERRKMSGTVGHQIFNICGLVNTDIQVTVWGLWQDVVAPPHHPRVTAAHVSHSHTANYGKLTVKLPLSVISQHAMNACGGSGFVTPHILNLHTRWNSTVDFRPPPLYTPRKSRGYPINRKPEGPLGRYGQWRKTFVGSDDNQRVQWLSCPQPSQNMKVPTLRLPKNKINKQMYIN